MSTQVNSVWDKWIERAVTKHFVTALSPLKVFAPNEILNLSGVKNYAKVRLYGDSWEEQTHGKWFKLFTVDVYSLAQPVSNMYEQETQSRNIAAAFPPGICVEDLVPAHVLIISIDSNEKIKILRLGRRDIATEIFEHSISCQYRGHINA